MCRTEPRPEAQEQPAHMNLPSPAEIASELRAPFRRRRVQDPDLRRVMERMRQTRAIFVHVPKTGGKSISSELYGTGLHEGFGHASAMFYRDLFGAISYQRHFSFAFVRNPWDRAYSAFRFGRAGGFGFKMGQEMKKAIGHMDFKTFVKEWLEGRDLSPYVIFRPQHGFLCDSTGRILVDRVCRFERFDQEYAYLKERLGLGEIAMHINKSETGSSYTEVYDEETRDIVGRIYSQDVKLFGYSFG